MKLINGVEHVWDILENQWVTLASWNEIERARKRMDRSVVLS